MEIFVGTWVGTSVAGLVDVKFCQLRATRKTPATESRRHAPARQPAIQPVDLPSFGAVLVTGAVAVARGAGAEIISGARCAGSFSSKARFQVAANSAAVAKRSRGSLASALRITCSMDAGISGLIEEGKGKGSLTC